MRTGEITAAEASGEEYTAIAVGNGRAKIFPRDRAAWLKLRAHDVTSTESPMLYGLSPYGTEFNLYHQKRDNIVVDFEANERMGWGIDLQDSIATAFGRRYGVAVRPMREYMRMPDAKMGASFDFEVTGIDGTQEDKTPRTPLQQMFLEHGPGLLEIKNVDSLIFRDKWIKKVTDDEFVDYKKKIIEPPGYIDIQVQQQMHVSEHGWGCIGVLVGGNRGEIVLRKRDTVVGDSLEARIRRFWDAVKTGNVPAPSFPADAAVIARLYGHAEPGTVFDGRGNEDLMKALEDYSEALTREKLAVEDKGVARAKALMIIGEAERAIVDGYTVSAGVVGPTRVEAYDRKGYRGWRVTKAKDKK